jgi:hypothetical protein
MNAHPPHLDAPLHCQTGNSRRVPYPRDAFVSRVRYFEAQPSVYVLTLGRPDCGEGVVGVSQDSAEAAPEAHVDRLAGDVGRGGCCRGAAEDVVRTLAGGALLSNQSAGVPASPAMPPSNSNRLDGSGAALSHSATGLAAALASKPVEAVGEATALAAEDALAALISARARGGGNFGAPSAKATSA